MKYHEIRALAEKHTIRLIYLFGSQAEAGKKYLEGENMMFEDTSDLDVAVLLDTPPPQAIAIYGILYREFSKIFDPFAIDLILLLEINPLLQYEIIKGFRIYERDEVYADKFEENVMKRAEDLSFKKRIFDNEIMESIEWLFRI